MTLRHLIASIAFLTFALVLAGCDKENAAPSSGKSSARNGAPADSTRDGQAEPAPGHGGEIVELGTTTIGPFTVRAARDQGEIKAGGDAPIDVWLNPGSGGGDLARVIAVRFWIGTERGEDFVKARADIEIPSEPNHWHTHAEVPSPLPADSRLWVEIEVEGQGKQVGSFDLNA